MNRVSFHFVVFVLLLFVGCTLFVHYAIPFLLQSFAVDIASYFENFSSATVGWNFYIYIFILLLCFFACLVKKKWAKVVVVFFVVLITLACMQINTVPLWRIVVLAVLLLGG